MKSRPTLASLAIGALLLVLGTPATLALAQTSVTVTLTDSTSPRTAALPQGGTVTIVNHDDQRHRLRARDPEDVDTGNLEAGERMTLTLSVAGTYRFVDERTGDPAYAVTVEVGGTDTGGDGSAGAGVDTPTATSGDEAPDGPPAPSRRTLGSWTSTSITPLRPRPALSRARSSTAGSIPAG
ncbi:MAG: hypothetical protein R3343_02735 [Nitriliruptorales bacterium]|nr:hypothetical protein [Nitriliruptorales bacterium]